MSGTTEIGLLDVSNIDLESLKILQIPALTRVSQRCLAGSAEIVAGFTSAVEKELL